MAAKTVRVTQTKSAIGRLGSQRQTLIGLGLNKILGTIHIYPTLAEANKSVAGEWKRAHTPATVLRWLARFHRWRLGGSADSQ